MKTQTKSLYFKMRMTPVTRRMLANLAKLEGRSGGNMISKLIVDAYHKAVKAESRKLNNQ